MAGTNPSNEKCGATLANGRGCAFPAGRCPSHEELRPAAAEPEVADVPAPAPRARKRKPETPDIRKLAQDALEAVSNSNASPTLATRFVHAVRAVEAMGPSKGDEVENLREAALLGSIMHGIPPRDREDWEYLEEIMDPYSMHLLYRWYPWTWYEDIALDKVPNGAGALHDPDPEAQFMRERKEWGERNPGWEDLDEMPEPPPWRTRIRSRYGPNPPAASVRAGIAKPAWPPEHDDDEDDDDDW